MSRIDTELGRIRKVLQQNFKDLPGRAEEEELSIKKDIKRGDAFVLIANLLTPEEGHTDIDEITAAENRSKERIFLQVKTLSLPQNRKVKVIFQSIEDRENDELFHLLHKKARK